MPAPSYVYQLFHAEQCQSYLHALRWKDRPFQCPHGQSSEVDPLGTYHYRPGCKTLPVQTLSAYLQRPYPDPVCPSQAVTLSLATRHFSVMPLMLVPSHREGGGCACPYELPLVLVAAQCRLLLCETQRQLAGTVEADELYHSAGNKGQAEHGGKRYLGRRARRRRKKREPGRPAIIAWVCRRGPIVVQAVRDFTVETVQQAADLAVQAGSRLYTDSAGSYRALKGYLHAFVNHTQKE